MLGGYSSVSLRLRWISLKHTSMTRFDPIIPGLVIVICDYSQTKNSAAVMRINYYPPQTGLESEGIVGIGAHSE